MLAAGAAAARRVRVLSGLVAPVHTRELSGVPAYRHGRAVVGGRWRRQPPRPSRSAQAQWEQINTPPRIKLFDGKPEPYFAQRDGSRIPGSKDVELHLISGANTLVLNRPEQLNALTLDMVRAITKHLDDFEANEHADVLIMAGAGSRAFCAGGDVKTVAQLRKTDPQHQLDFFREEYRLNHMIATCPKPIVCFLDGITMGGGVGLSIHAPFRVATENSVFAMPETAIGFFPDVGGTYRLPRLFGWEAARDLWPLGLYLGLTGARLTGRQLLKAGIATHYIPSERLWHLQVQLGNTNHELTRFLVPPTNEAGEAQAAQAAWTSFDVVDRVLTMSQEPHAAEDADPAFDELLEVVAKSFSAPTLEEILARLAKLDSPWGDQTAQSLRRMSPTALKVTMRALVDSRAQRLSLEECLEREFVLAQRFMKGEDFYEGVRAVLIDKDRKPAWKPATLEAVTLEDVNAYFRPQAGDERVGLRAERVGLPLGAHWLADPEGQLQDGELPYAPEPDLDVLPPPDIEIVELEAAPPSRPAAAAARRS